LLAVAAACTTGGLGCYSPERDLLQDPHNTPLVHILDADYVPESGAVFLRWEYLGRDPATLFRLSRTLAGRTREFATVAASPGPEPARIVASHVDSHVVSGERALYTVTAARENGLAVGSAPVGVDIPGARMQAVVPDPSAGSIRVVWGNPVGDVVGFEVVRQETAGEDVVVFRSTDASPREYVDHDVRGNTTYRYRVRCTMAAGARLHTDDLAATLYALAAQHPPSSLGLRSGSLRIVPGLTDLGASLVAVVRDPGGGDQAGLVRYEVGWGLDGHLRVYAFIDAIHSLGAPLQGRAGPLAVAGPSLWRGAGPVAGIYTARTSPDGGDVEVDRRDLPLLDVVWSARGVWAEYAQEVALAADPYDRVWLAGGGVLRVLGASGSEVAAYPLTGGRVDDLWATDSALWAVRSASGSVSHAEVDFAGGLPGSLQWTQLGMAPYARPVAITGNRSGQVHVLDSESKRVTVYEPSGAHLMGWDLPPGDYDGGDISVDASAGTLVHVSDAAGTILTYLP